MRLAFQQVLRVCRDTLFIAVLLGSLGLRAAELVNVPQLGLRVSAGFRVSLFAGPNLADNIYAMTFNARGEVVVTGPGYVRTLVDINNDGVADRAVDYANTPGGGMGMCFDGNTLIFVGDGAVWRFQDGDGDGQADAAPERLLSLQSGEHGGHAVRKGPDGAYYIIGGNDSRFGEVPVSGRTFPPGKVEGGALFRLELGRPGARLVAHGFRNPYDFDFNSFGELFTYDSDVERDFFLPWYVPTRVYHIAPGGHHGWRLEGYMRSWPRPGRYVDTVESLAELGRGSPTGVACYRHTQFPEYFQRGLFVSDWTFGRIYFVRLQEAGSSYRGLPEIFLESTGTEGFAPTSLAVGPDGSLFVSTGGRNTRGSVYRIEYIAEPGRRALAAGWREAAASDIQLIATAPQPLDAWSRVVWRFAAERLDPEILETVVTDNSVTPEQRVRVLEVLTEVHDGLTAAGALTCAQSASSQLRARVAWAIGIKPVANSGTLLLALARDNAPEVRVAALETLRELLPPPDVVTRQQALAVNLGHPDKRVRQAAAQLAATLPDTAWSALWKQQEQLGAAQSRLTTVLASLWRDGIFQVQTTAVQAALTILNQTRAPDAREQALRLVLLGLGDYHLDKPSLEAYTAYESPFALNEQAALLKRLEKSLLALLPSGDVAVDVETTRLLAMIESSDPSVPGKVIGLCTARSEAKWDFHYLTVFSRLKAPGVTNFTSAVAAALLGLDRKLDPSGSRPRQNWSDRQVEVAGVLLSHDPRLRDALLRHPDFARPSHLALVPLLSSDRYVACARVFFGVIQRTPEFPWTEGLVELLAALPAEETHPLFRRRLDNATLRDRLLVELAAKPQLSDRESFVAGLSSPRPEVVRASMTALMQLPNDTGTGTVVAVLRVLRRLLNEPKEQTARAQAVALLGRLSGQKFNVEERGPEFSRNYQPIFTWFETRYAAISRQLDVDDHESPAQWEMRLRNVPWDRGSVVRGYQFYTARGCQNCHDGARALGPDLAGVAQRYSAPDLIRAVLYPSREIAAPYRMTTFHLRDGQTYTGLVAFESADGVIVRTGPSATVRLAESDITGREASTVSFMPSGLLTGCSPQDLADLCVYLKTLPAPEGANSAKE